ncbi:MAG: Ldh family oxidoreductase [Firmicutes bacterium]|nr:Ldh family oxidoreductase [Bacillota bacterium]
MSENKRIQVDLLRGFAKSVLKNSGLSEKDSAIAADIIVTADMRGVSSHGMVALPGYVTQMQKGGIDPNSDIKVLAESPATTLVDGCAGMGQVVSYKSMALAIEKAKKSGACVVSVRNSNHLGACAYYSMMCAKENMLGIATSNAAVLMAPTGGAGQLIGNNPLSIAVPTGEGYPMVLDMAMSVVAAGKLFNAMKAGEQIPEGWSLDSMGRPTTNPADLYEGGTLLPVGGYKGYGLALMVEVLAGVLSGAALTVDIVYFRGEPEKPTNSGHMFIALDITKFMSIDSFKSRIGELIGRMQNAPKSPGVDRIFVPGEIESEAYNYCKEHGVALAEPVIKDLRALGEETGVRFPG